MRGVPSSFLLSGKHLCTSPLCPGNHRHKNDFHETPSSPFFVTIFSLFSVSHFLTEVYLFLDEEKGTAHPRFAVLRHPVHFPAGSHAPVIPPPERTQRRDSNTRSNWFKSLCDSHKGVAPQGRSHNLRTRLRYRPPPPAVAQAAQGRRVSSSRVTLSIVR